MRADVTPFIRLFFSCVGVLALAGCAGDPDAVVAGALSASERQGEPYVYGDGHAPDKRDQSAWGSSTVHTAGLRGDPMLSDTEGPYLLDTGDKLRVFVYGQPNLSRAYTVDQDGQITVPLIGAVQARGRTTRNLENSIRSRLGEEFVRDPQVTVDILQNRPFFIYGEVKSGGQYPFVSGMTVETAIAIAGGYSERASTRSYRITLRLNGFVDQIEAPSDYPLLPGDTVYVNERFF
jgi:polysaccharide export outer membrane protein